MKIRALTVRNFRGISRWEGSFVDDADEVRPLTVLVGPNRCGKTTILDALHLVASSLENARSPGWRPEFNPDDPRLRPDVRQPIEVELTFSLREDEWTAIQELCALLGDHGDLPELQREYSVHFAWPWPEGSDHGVVRQTPPRASRALRGRAKAKIALKNRQITDRVMQAIGGVLYLDQHRSVAMVTPITSTATEPELAGRASGPDILPWMELQARLAARWNTERKGESRWAQACRVYAQLARSSQIDDIEPFSDGFDLRLRDARTGRTYYSSGSSGGERQLLRIAVNLVAWQAYHSVVLIDELELHLHPRWQRNLLHFCQQGGGGQNQFIVTTHSESILRYVDPRSIIELGSLESG